MDDSGRDRLGNPYKKHSPRVEVEGTISAFA